MLQNVVECMDHAECAKLALDEGDVSEHAHVQSYREATPVRAASARGGAP